MKLKLPYAEYIGQVAVFYIPATKLDVPIETGLTARQMLHEFFVANYSAYTHEISKIHGYWINKDILVKDEHERFEVSFKGEEKVKDFVCFLSKICGLIQEDCVYLTMGYKSWLVFPQSSEQHG
jgi:hypothetical protein